MSAERYIEQHQRGLQKPLVKPPGLDIDQEAP
jgi:hypothetical protein